MDYVVDARLGSNIYTMNYGEGNKQPHMFTRRSAFGADTTVGTGQYDDMESIDLFDKKSVPRNYSYYEQLTGQYARNNKLFFHSLPMTHRSTIPFDSGLEVVNLPAAVLEHTPGIYAVSYTHLTLPTTPYV